MSFKTYIIHVSTDQEREAHMRSLLEPLGFDYEFINFGDIKDLSEDIIGRYFEGEILEKKNLMSCAFKHLYAYERILQEDQDWALVLEDDIFFTENALEVLDHIKNEIQVTGIQNAIISLENSTLERVPKAQRKHGVFIYPAPKGRCAGAYLVDKQAAQNISNYLLKRRCSLPLDWFHNKMAEDQVFSFYWSEPTIAEQGSHNGKIKSYLDKGEKTSFDQKKKRVNWAFSKFWRKFFSS